MKLNSKRMLLYFALQLLIYGVMVVLYLVLVLQFLSDWIVATNHKSRELYAVLSLLLIVGQGLLLERLTTALLHSMRGKG